MFDADILAILCCPETHQALAPAPAEMVQSLNAKISAASLKNRAGHAVTEPIDAGLVRADGKYLYAIRNDIPIMLIDEAIPLP